MPKFFAETGLREIKIFPIASVFSLSDVSMEKKEKLRYIENLYRGECKRLEAAMQLQKFRDHFSNGYYGEYRELLERRYQFWKTHLDDNGIWEWTAALALLTSGKG